MFYAINSITKEKVNSLTVENDPSYNLIDEEVWYADPDEIESCPNTVDIKKIEVRFREGANDIINWNGTKYSISPHFAILNKTGLGINTIPESKEHKLAKNWIYNKLKNNKDRNEEFKIAYSTVSKPIKYNNCVDLFKLPIDKKMIGIECGSTVTFNKTGRRADVICPFITKHPILGNGIVFEIQFSKQRKKTEEDRELDWAIRGYSVCWIFEKDIEKISETIFITKEEELKVDSFAALIKRNNVSLVRNLKYTVKEEMRKIEWKKDLIIKEIFDSKLEKIDFQKEDIRDIVEDMFEELKSQIQPMCPKCKIPFIKRNRRIDNQPFWVCSICDTISSY